MRQSEIWLLNLDPTIGVEIKKTRPAVIVNDDLLGKLPLKIVVPLTGWKDKYSLAPWMVKIVAKKRNGLIKDSLADCFQIRSLSKDRFVKKIGVLPIKIMEEIKNGIRKVLSIGSI